MSKYLSSRITKYSWFICAFSFLIIVGCKSKKDAQPLFVVLEGSTTGLDFINKVTSTPEMNMLKYMYFYNGAGIGAGDFNNDGLTDLFFSSNQDQNKIFLNQGKLKFKDVTALAQIPRDEAWSTGVSVADINADGLLDIYVCRVGNFESLKSKNQLLICKGIDKSGIPFYKDEAQAYGLDFSGFSTQSAFFDYDLDGDLDMFLLNHSVHQNGNYAPREKFMNTYDLLSGDRLYRNNGNNSFSDVTKESAINSFSIGYGLGIVVSDINLDGWPDVYIGNDFHENDYMYINQKNGTFKEELTNSMMHTSKFSMGVDVADINNDAYPEIISLDMLPADPYILKKSLGGDEYDVHKMKIAFGYNHQYSRNTLQLNRRNGMFSEVGLFSGIAATDWSWAPLWVDFDNDGLKDLFISNGIPKRLNDIDYINFVLSTEMQEKIRFANMAEKDMALIEKFPEIKLPNKFYLNNGNLSFTDVAGQIEGNKPGFSNGAAYADFDNDGDLDIIVNNIDAPVTLYENKASHPGSAKSLTLRLKGPAHNKNALGARVILYAGKEVRTYEKYPVKGFLSSMEIPLLIGLTNTSVDSMFLIWPDNTYQRVVITGDRTDTTLAHRTGLPGFDFKRLVSDQNETNVVSDVTGETGVSFLHEENQFAEFDREPLIPRMVSTEGPALAVADINHDGLDDVFLGAARNRKSGLFLQLASGKFMRSFQPVLETDSIYEDVAACWADVNNDRHTDLVVASGGNEFYGKDEHNTPRIYLNDGKGNLSRQDNAFTNLFLTASSVAPMDVNMDGFIDLFIGARAVPYEYGKTPKSYLLINDKTGRFKDETAQYAGELTDIGFVTNAVWFDLDKDNDKDLLLSLEWGPVTAFMNNKGKLTKKILADKKGWWNFLLPFDADNDGDVDIVCGNLGLNSRLRASEEEPVKLYYNDFDGNGKNEQVLTYFLDGKEIPFANKAELEKQLPVLKKKFLYAEDFAKATLGDLFTTQKLQVAEKQTANYFANAILINKGNLQFDINPLPWEAQLTSLKDAVVVDANNDNLQDLLLVGNFYENNIEMGRYDADFGTVLINKGKGSFVGMPLNNPAIKGQVRHVQPIKIGTQQAFILARNNDSARLIMLQK